MPLQLVGEPHPSGPASTECTTPWYWKEIQFFGGASDDARRAFFASANKCEYAKGRHIFFSNDPASSVFYLGSGLVKIYSLSDRGEITIHWFCVAGEIFGMGGISGSSDQMAFAQAVEDSSVFKISRSNFEALLREHSELSFNVIKLMGARLRLSCDTVSGLASQSADKRLALQLLRLAESCGRIRNGNIEIRPHITHQEFANMIGSCRQTVTMALQDFRDRGWIDMTARCTTILAIGELQKFAETSGLTSYSPRQEDKLAGHSKDIKKSNIPADLAKRYWRSR